MNRFLAAGGVNFGYDARGNLTSSGTLSYGYSAENRLVSAPGATLGYDPVGRLAQVTASAGGTGGNTVTRFAYVGLQMVAEAGASGTPPLRRYVYGPGLDSPIVWYEGADTCLPSPGAGAGGCNRRFLLADERGSIVSVADSAGAVLAINTYDEFGIPASTNVGRFQFSRGSRPSGGRGRPETQAWLPEAGLFYYKARMYSPTLGRFLQTDPIGYADGLNWYNYVGGDPINSVDPLGLEGDDIVITGRRETNEIANVCDSPAARFLTGCGGGQFSFQSLIVLPEFSIADLASAADGPDIVVTADPCSTALGEQGRIRTFGSSFSAALVFGIGITGGRFENRDTGTSGLFITFSLIVGVAAEAGGSTEIVDYRSLRELAGVGQSLFGNFNLGLAGAGVSTSYNLDNERVGTGFNFSLINPKDFLLNPHFPELMFAIGASGSETIIFNCRLKR